MFCNYSSSSAFIRNPFANAVFYCICGNYFVLIELICVYFSVLVNSRMYSQYHVNTSQLNICSMTILFHIFLNGIVSILVSTFRFSVLSTFLHHFRIRHITCRSRYFTFNEISILFKIFQYLFAQICRITQTKMSGYFSNLAGFFITER